MLVTSTRADGRIAMRKQTLALTVFCASALFPVGAVAAGLHAAPKAAHCKQWNVTGTWATHQANNFHIAFQFRQTGTTFTGTASLSSAEEKRAGYTSPTAPVTGTLKGSHLALKTVWQTPAGKIVGAYKGTVSKGTVTGSGRDITTPGAAALAWAGTGPTKCVRRG
jgi:hypothetical protein